MRRLRRLLIALVLVACGSEDESSSLRFDRPAASEPEPEIDASLPDASMDAPDAAIDAPVEASKPPLPVPTLNVVVAPGLHFTAASIRKPLEDGLRYAVERIVQNVDIGARKAPTLTVAFEESSDSFASGLADVTKATVWVPYGYPVTGSNQNYVVNISVHEIGHLLAHHLIADRSLRPDTCVNEGLASWIAGKYWMNANSQPVASLRAAARYEIDRGRASATMSTCVSASDAWYKVYASYFEYLEKNVPGAILAVSSGKAKKSAYAGAWQGWMQ